MSLYHIDFEAPKFYSNLSQCFASLSVVHLTVVEGSVFRERRRFQRSSEFSVRMPENIIFMYLKPQKKKRKFECIY